MALKLHFTILAASGFPFGRQLLTLDTAFVHIRNAPKTYGHEPKERGETALPSSPSWTPTRLTPAGALSHTDCEQLYKLALSGTADISPVSTAAMTWP